MYRSIYSIFINGAHRRGVVRLLGFVVARGHRRLPVVWRTLARSLRPHVASREGCHLGLGPGLDEEQWADQARLDGFPALAFASDVGATCSVANSAARDRR
jgi:hypothetical protein